MTLRPRRRSRRPATSVSIVATGAARRGSGHTLPARGFYVPPAFGARTTEERRGGPVSKDEHQYPEPSAQEARTSILMEVSNAMVRLYKEQFGRGPTRTRTFWAGPDALVCFLEDTLTPAERNLVNLGQHQRLRDMRTFFQYATLPEFCEPVGAHHRPQGSLVSQQHRHEGRRARDRDVHLVPRGRGRAVADGTGGRRGLTRGLPDVAGCIWQRRACRAPEDRARDLPRRAA